MDAEVIFNNQKYIFSDDQWYDAKSFLKPPSAIILQLNYLIKDKIEESDSKITDFNVCFELAQKIRRTEDIPRAMNLLSKALILKPNTVSVITVMSSILREQKRPLEALELTEDYKRRGDSALSTTRAAALCDLGRWEEAKKEIAISLAQSSSDEAFLVVKRIKANRPDLYQ